MTNNQFQVNKRLGTRKKCCRIIIRRKKWGTRYWSRTFFEKTEKKCSIRKHVRGKRDVATLALRTKPRSFSSALSLANWQLCRAPTQWLITQCYLTTFKFIVYPQLRAIVATNIRKFPRSGHFRVWRIHLIRNQVVHAEHYYPKALLGSTRFYPI